jgi:hypothetical protein
MTNIDPTITPEPTPAAPEAPKDYEALYRQQVQEAIKDREKYKPFAQVLDALAPEQRQAMLDLAHAAANGDTDAIAEWSAATYRNLTGSEVAARIAAQQNGTPAPAPAPAAPPATDKPAVALTAEQVAELVEQKVQAQLRQAEMVRQIESDLASAGYTPQSPAGQAIIQYAHQARLPIADAVAWYNADLEANYQRVQAARVGAAVNTPITAPTGAPAHPITGATPGERAVARLTQHAAQ